MNCLAAAHHCLLSCAAFSLPGCLISQLPAGLSYGVTCALDRMTYAFSGCLYGIARPSNYRACRQAGRQGQQKNKIDQDFHRIAFKHISIIEQWIGTGSV